VAHDGGLLEDFTFVLEKADPGSLRPFELTVLLEVSFIQGFGPDLNMVKAASLKRNNLAAARSDTHVEVELFILDLLITTVKKLDFYGYLQVICHLHRRPYDQNLLAIFGLGLAYHVK